MQEKHAIAHTKVPQQKQKSEHLIHSQNSYQLKPKQNKIKINKKKSGICILRQKRKSSKNTIEFILCRLSIAWQWAMTMLFAYTSETPFDLN